MNASVETAHAPSFATAASGRSVSRSETSEAVTSQMARDAVGSQKREKATFGDRAVAYLRVSTVDQQLGLEAQRAAIEAWARNASVAVVSWHVDHGISGATEFAERPGLLDAFTALDTHRAGLLAVAKRDRLARSVFVAATIEGLAQRAGARIVTADGANEDGPGFDLMRHIIDAFAQYERALIRTRTMAALKAKRRRGERTGGVPFGFDVLDDGKLVENAHELAAIARIRELHRAGLGVQAITGRLSSEGFRPRGERWHRTTVYRLLEEK